MADLTYVKTWLRLGLVVGDGGDDDEDPDTIWCDGGTVQLTPLSTFVKVAGGQPSPWTAGQAVVQCPVDANGFMSLNGREYVWLVDLTNADVNPVIPDGKATHKVDFLNVTANGTKVAFPSFNVRIAADTVDPATGGVDLTLVSPVPAAGGTPIVVGPPGPVGVSVTELAVSAGDLTYALSDGSTGNAGALPVGPGGSDAGVASYMASGTATDAGLSTLIAPTASSLTSVALTAGITADGSAMGDSITHGYQNDATHAPAVPYATLISQYAGISIYNPSVPGEEMSDISVRFGARTLTFTVPGGVIPNDTSRFPVTLTDPASNTGFVGTPVGSPQSDWMGSFLGIPVNVHYDSTTGGTGWTMARQSTTNAGTIPTPVPTEGGVFRATAAPGARDGFFIGFGGRNGGDVVGENTKMVAYLHGDNPRFVVMDQLTGGADHNQDHSAIINGLTALASTSSNGHYYDMRTYMIEHGLDDEGITATTQDQTDIANDTVPTSLRFDNIHPNASGQRVIARRLTELMIEWGWLDATTTYVPPRVVPLPPPPTAPQQLSLPSTTATATLAASDDVQGLQKFSLRMLVNLASTTAIYTLARRTTGADGNRVWQAYRLNTGTLRMQTFPAGTNTGSNAYDATTADALAANTWTWIRYDFDATVSSCTYYESADGETWNQIGTARTTTASALFDATAPVVVGGFAGALRHFQLLSLDGATTYIDEDFTPTAGDGWVLAGGAELVDQP